MVGSQRLTTLGASCAPCRKWMHSHGDLDHRSILVDKGRPYRYLTPHLIITHTQSHIGPGLGRNANLGATIESLWTSCTRAAGTMKAMTLMCWAPRLFVDCHDSTAGST
jgi:hypothetical protein